MATNLIGHGILSAVAIFSIHENPSLSWISITFELLLAHGLLGLIQCFIDSPAFANLFAITNDIVEILPLAFINTQFLLTIKPALGYLHAISAISPLLINSVHSNQYDNERIKSIVVFGNVGSAIYLAIELKNLWFLGLACISLLNRFALDKQAEKFRVDKAQALSVGLAIFCILLTFCLKSLI